MATIIVYGFMVFVGILVFTDFDVVVNVFVFVLLLIADTIMRARERFTSEVVRTERIKKLECDLCQSFTDSEKWYNYFRG